jgi:hypothetical protein
MKIIIKNHTNLDFTTISKEIDAVIKLGRISNNNKQYCHLSTFTINSIKYYIIA